MSDSKESEAVVHDMSDKKKELYEIFYKSREEVRKSDLEEDIKVRNLFLELGKKAAEEEAAGKQIVDDNKKF
jgi:hypothetical protein